MCRGLGANSGAKNETATGSETKFPACADVQSHLDSTDKRAYTGHYDVDMRRMERYRMLAEDAGVVTFDYDPATDVLDYSVHMPDGACIEGNVSDYLARLETCTHIAPQSRETCRAHLSRALRAPTRGSFVYRADFFGEGYLWYHLRYLSKGDADGRVYRVVGRADEAEEEMAIRAELERSARIDGVTGLCNRLTVQRCIEAALAEPRKAGCDALFMIDIDDFKRINDTRGHVQGDAALAKVADAIRTVFRAEDVKGRFGGDEFVVYARAFRDPALPGTVARRFAEYLAAVDSDIRCSMGIALVYDRAQFEDVVARADGALYCAKRAHGMMQADHCVFGSFAYIGGTDDEGNRRNLSNDSAQGSIKEECKNRLRGMS